MKKPVSGTKEWAKHNFNVIIGCSHGCKYCYACAMAVRFKRMTCNEWITESHPSEKKIKLFDGRVMFPTTHDITPENISTVLPYIKGLLEKGNELLIVSKPHYECVKKMCDTINNFQNKVIFRFTIGSQNSEILKFWEPYAPCFEERFDSLKYAFKKGFETSLSIEPMLDTLENIRSLIKVATPYIRNSIWVGKPNRLLTNLKFNGTYDNESKKRLDYFKTWYNDNNIISFYNSLKTNKIVKWKESIKKVVGLQIATEKGLDL